MICIIWVIHFIKCLYDVIKELTYIQFILPYDTNIAVTEDTYSTIPLKTIEYEDKYKSDLLKYYENIRKDRDIINEDSWSYLRNNILMEHTPLGNVIMYYDSVKDTFCYYSDRIIPYKYIDTVCRKYVIKFKCVKLYFDIDNNIVDNSINTTTQTPTQTQTKEIKEEEEDNNKNIFVKLKSYNKSNLADGVSGASTAKSSDQNRYINRYTYEGKLMNFNMLQKPEKKKFSYLDFKKVK
jgi:hypothetical protein